DRFCLAQIDDAFQTRLKTFERLHRLKPRRVTADANVRLFAVVRDPREVAGRDCRIEKTMQPRWSIERDTGEHVFNADDPFTIQLEPEVASDARGCAVSAD